MKTLLLITCSLAACGCAKKSAAPQSRESSAQGSHPDHFIEQANVVELSAEAQKRAGIETRPIRYEPVSVQITATGTIQPVDGRFVHVRAMSKGRVHSMLVKAGDAVRRDQDLVQFDSIEAGELATQLSVSRAEAARLGVLRANAQRQAERSRALAKIGAVPAKEAEAAEAELQALNESMRAQQDTTAGIELRLSRFGDVGQPGKFLTIRAPSAGVVVNVASAAGEVVESGEPLLSVADLSRVNVEARVYEKDLVRIRLGQAAIVSVDAFPNEPLQVHVTSIAGTLDPQTRTASVRCEVPNPSNRLKVEMFATVVLSTTESHSALAVPDDAVQTIQRRNVVFVRKDGLHFEAREVQALGEGQKREIAAGLKPGDEVVVKGAFQLKSVFLSREIQAEHAHD